MGEALWRSAAADFSNAAGDAPRTSSIGATAPTADRQARASDFYRRMIPRPPCRAIIELVKTRIPKRFGLERVALL
jgi:hypothetical protein